jgi:hypothetical protein
VSLTLNFSLCSQSADIVLQALRYKQTKFNKPGSPANLQMNASVYNLQMRPWTPDIDLTTIPDKILYRELARRRGVQA